MLNEELLENDVQTASMELRQLEGLVREKLCGEGATDDDPTNCALETDPGRVCWFLSMTEFHPVELAAGGKQELAMFGRNVVVNAWRRAGWWRAHVVAANGRLNRGATTSAVAVVAIVLVAAVAASRRCHNKHRLLCNGKKDSEYTV